MMINITEEARSQVVAMVRDFIDRDVEPLVEQFDREDTYPSELIDKMAEMGLFGITIPREYGGQGFDYVTFAMIFEELSKGWMSLTGPIGTHHLMAYIINSYGTDNQKRYFLPRMSDGTIRGGFAMTEPEGGSDAQNIRTRAIKVEGGYILKGRKMFITNAQNGNAFVVFAKTNMEAIPPHTGISCLVIEKPVTGLSIGGQIDKLGYRGLDTCEMVFEDCRVSADSLVGEEGKGFQIAMSALEVGRINVAARSVGVATAAFETSIKYAQRRETFGVPIAQHQAIQLKLADMATKIRAARLLTYDAAAKKDTGERADLDAGMAKLFASEVCGEVTMEAMRIHGGYGYVKNYPVERFYRDAPLMMIGEGTNEIQKLVIARRLLERYSI